MSSSHWFPLQIKRETTDLAHFLPSVRIREAETSSGICKDINKEVKAVMCEVKNLGGVESWVFLQNYSVICITWMKFYHVNILLTYESYVA